MLLSHHVWENRFAADPKILGDTIRLNGVPTTVELLRGDQTLTVTVTPTSRDYYTFDAAGDVVYDAAGEPVLAPSGFFGMQPGTERHRFPIGTGVEVTREYLGLTFTAVRELPQHVASASMAILGLQERDTEGVISIVGAGRIAGEQAAAEAPFIDKLISSLALLAGINLALFVFNMIPLLPLDGGHIAGEHLRSRGLLSTADAGGRRFRRGARAR